MLVSTISLWGAAMVACIVIIASIALAFFDRQMLRRIWFIFGATVAQMAVVVAVVWLIYQTYAWWATLLWFLLVLVLSICWCLYPLKAIWRKILWPVSAAMIQTVANYQRNLHNPKALLHESILKQIRLMVQPLVMVIPMLYAGMLLGGFRPLRV